MRLGDRLAALAGLDSTWERPGPTRRERQADIAVAVALVLDAAIFLELLRSYTDFSGARPVWLEYLVLVTIGLPLAVRRRWPLAVALYACVHLIVCGIFVGEAVYVAPMQVAYFLAFFTALAWGRDRRAALIVFGACAFALLAWLALTYAVGTGVDDLLRQVDSAKEKPHGLLPPVAAGILSSALVNVLYLGGAAAWGLQAWHAARTRALVAEQNRQLAEQAETLRDQAVVDERLRIARELHDVVAHHVSVMGVQAGAARRVLTKNPDAAAEALAAVESSSRQAVGEMRALLGTLRGASGQAAPEGDSREPQPTLGELPALVASYAEPGFEPVYSLVEDEPGAAAAVPMPVALVLYRTAQEALTNVRKHSTARAATVTVRVTRDGAGPRFAEVEVVDDGRPLGGTSGTGLGLLGMRERIASAGGQVEVGPRICGGYRVRVRIPLSQTADAAPLAPAALAGGR